MATVYVRLADGVAVMGLHGTLHTVEPGLRAVTVADLPRDLRTVRWNGDQGLRAETTEEQIVRETVQKGDTAEAELATTRAVDALVTVLAPKLGLDPTVLRAEVVTELTRRVGTVTDTERLRG